MQVQEISSENLIGNCGGYVGLFVGYSILQVPELIVALYAWIKRLFKKRISIRNGSARFLGLENQVDSVPTRNSTTDNASLKDKRNQQLLTIQEQLGTHFSMIQEIQHTIDGLIQEIEDK